MNNMNMKGDGRRESSIRPEAAQGYQQETPAQEIPAGSQSV